MSGRSAAADGTVGKDLVKVKREREEAKEGSKPKKPKRSPGTIDLTED